MLRAVLFDMDGVIVNSEPLHRKAYYQMFSEFNLAVPDTLYDSFTGQATLSICERLCQEFELTVPATHLVARKRAHFKNYFENDIDFKLIDGVYDLIADYYESGLRLVLASSASMANINQIFKRFDLDRFFIAKISGADLIASKPHPEIFIKAAAVSGCDPSECMVIEDSMNGIRAAHEAGIYCVAFKNTHTKNQNYQYANKVIAGFDEIAPTQIPLFFPNA